MSVRSTPGRRIGKRWEHSWKIIGIVLVWDFSEDDESSASDEDTDPEVSFSPKSAASILSAGVGGISVLKSSAMGKCVNGNR